MKSLGKPILQLELARNEDDIRAILMKGDKPRNLADARAGNLLDTWLFIPGYAGLLLTLGLLLARGTCRDSLLIAALVLVPVIAIADWTENAGIERAIEHIAPDHGEPHPGDAHRISTPSIVKWTLIAVVLLWYGVAGVISVPSWYAAWPGVIATIALIAGFAEARQLAGYFRERFF